MSFAENLKKVRKERNLSQEELAEMMDVSRQSVSKWEQGESYPEVEKLLLLSQKLNLSLDALLSAEISGAIDRETTPGTGTILITSPTENVIAPCYKVTSSQQMKGGKHAPQYALFGFGGNSSAFWGEPTTFLGWYADRENISKEIHEIHQAILQGCPSYTLKYSAKVKRNWLHISIID